MHSMLPNRLGSRVPAARSSSRARGAGPGVSPRGEPSAPSPSVYAARARQHRSLGSSADALALFLSPSASAALAAPAADASAEDEAGGNSAADIAALHDVCGQLVQLLHIDGPRSLEESAMGRGNALKQMHAGCKGCVEGDGE